MAYSNFHSNFSPFIPFINESKHTTSKDVKSIASQNLHSYQPSNTVMQEDQVDLP